MARLLSRITGFASGNLNKALSLTDDPEDPEGSRRDKALAKERS